MSDLIGKVVLITGSSRGIGSAIAKELAHKGASVIINFSQDNLGAEKTLEEIQLNGGYAKIIKKDISNSVNCKELIEEVISIFGKIDILINNAAKSQVGLFMDFTEEDIEGLINTNLLSAMYLSKYALPYMISKNYGNIINISSIWGEVGASCEVVYSTTKGGLNLFTKSLAKEVAPFNIRVNSIAPGVINTEMNSFLSEEEKQNLIDEIPMNRFGDVSEIAKAVAFLCSDDSKYLTGQIIKIDGAFI
ncbi:elongation factor P 5-aminopentanone reductase [Clostridium celatum]|uniref:Putative 3-oxoacyl-[acyl-carrier-protein] reductase n=1 Tax=Clostridium celatum DSM 1785 TaxID=545697 RepID=L1QDG3_9CLOT|nr:SDR family oxidoreductase [Clostridium celatum]EKY25986.1 putative 3-oxoacyl-[acyl-carrier-protein] reductase [Clostridium celatum DSM 1785]MCE9655962.1 SDR family oxidoreductase [Clostridium celatum]MDU3723629.1 SDR family oxidoreductase [Clostridium celatum]MDU6295890.1 SDR family oxidoreductase [Clostridium celatum]